MSNTVNKLVEAMADRAEQLANLPIDQLRLTHPDVVGNGTKYEANQVTRGMNRGTIIHHILLEEFSEEFDKEIEQ